MSRSYLTAGNRHKRSPVPTRTPKLPTEPVTTFLDVPEPPKRSCLQSNGGARRCMTVAGMAQKEVGGKARPHAKPLGA